MKAVVIVALLCIVGLAASETASEKLWEDWIVYNGMSGPAEQGFYYQRLTPTVSQLANDASEAALISYVQSTYSIDINNVTQCSQRGLLACGQADDRWCICGGSNNKIFTTWQNWW
jgi:hypothetical protein